MVTKIHECCLLCMNLCKTAEDQRPYSYTHWAHDQQLINFISEMLLPRTGYCKHYEPYQQLVDFISELLKKADPTLNL